MAGSIHFGQYLLSRGVITREQLIEAIEHQRATHLLLGEYAIGTRQLSRGEVRQILEHQRKIGCRFGEAAIDLQLLTQKQVDGLLRRQQSDRVMLGQVLVRLGYVTAETLQVERHRFDRLAFESDRQSACVPTSIPMADLADDVFVLSRSVIAEAWKVDTKMGYVQLAMDKLYLKDINASIVFSGDVSPCYFVGAPRAIAQRGATQLLDLHDADEDLLHDVACELANMIAGGFVAQAAARGLKCLFTTPRPAEAVVELDARQALWIPLLADDQYIVAAMTIGPVKRQKK